MQSNPNSARVTLSTKYKMKPIYDLSQAQSAPISASDTLKWASGGGTVPALEEARYEATKMVASYRQEATSPNRSLQMEMMIVMAGLMSMMAVSLFFQRKSYKRVRVRK